tara:strand:+ start:881 stop:1189 length:309 start_codon:yes stop_codon:yes gene_type:complete
MIAVHTTINTKEAAKNLASSLVKEDLIACGSYFEINSIYKWEGKYTEDQEYEVVCYTKDDVLEKVVKYIKENHSYDLPKIITFKAHYTLPEYENWINSKTKN